MTRPCLLCGKDIEPDGHGGHENDAVVFTDSAGYGSKYDLKRFQFVICDNCIDSSLANGRMLHLGDDTPWFVCAHDHIEKMNYLDNSYDYQAYQAEIREAIQPRRQTPEEGEAAQQSHQQEQGSETDREEITG